MSLRELRLRFRKTAHGDEAPPATEECLGQAGNTTEVTPAALRFLVERQRGGGPPFCLCERGSSGRAGASDAAELDGQTSAQLARKVEGVG